MQKQVQTNERLRQTVLYYAMLGLAITTLLSALEQQFPVSSLVSILVMPLISVSVCLFSKTGKRFLISLMILQTGVLAVNVIFLLRN